MSPGLLIQDLDFDSRLFDMEGDFVDISNFASGGQVIKTLGFRDEVFGQLEEKDRKPKYMDKLPATAKERE